MSLLYKRYRDNPFMENMLISTKNKQVRVSSMGNDNNVVINQETGEVKGTHIVTYKEVDDAQFIKLFTQNIALTFDLTAAGLKALTVVIWAIQGKALNKDEVTLDSFILEDFLISNELKLSIATFKRGLNELEKSKILAKTIRKGIYFINPNFIFNGDRIAFTTAIKRKKKNEYEIAKEGGQIDIFE